MFQQQSKEQIAEFKLAIRKEDMESLEKFFNNGFNVNTVLEEADKFTPLHVAARWGNEKVVKFLLEHGADFKARGADYSRSTALQLASRWGHIEVVKLLLERVAETDTNGRESAKALNNAAESGHKDVVEVLLKCVNGGDSVQQKLRALYNASQFGHTEVVKLLLSNIPEENIGESLLLKESLEQALKRNHPEIAKLLIEKNLKIGNDNCVYDVTHVVFKDNYPEAVNLVVSIILEIGNDKCIERALDMANCDNCVEAAHYLQRKEIPVATRRPVIASDSPLCGLAKVQYSKPKQNDPGLSITVDGVISSPSIKP